MHENRVPMTPAELMFKIRETIIGGEGDPEEALKKLVIYLQSSDYVQDRLRDLENRAWIRETEFRSHAPLIASLIVTIRNLWNWMSTKWYVLPMVQQQNNFNAAVVQIIRDLWILNRALLSTISQLQLRLDALEQEISQLKCERPVDQ